MEPDARADKDTGNAVQWRDANAERAADRADHRPARQVRQDRRQKRVLLVPKPQGA